MPPRYRPYVPEDLGSKFANGKLTWNTSMDSTEFKYVNGYMSSRVAPGVITLKKLVSTIMQAIHESDEEPLEVIKEVVAYIAENERAHTCSSGYLVRPINRMGFNAIINLLRYAKTHPPPGIDTSSIPTNVAEELICRWNEGIEPTDAWAEGQPFCHKINSRGSVGRERSVLAVRKCPCIQTEGQCNNTENCSWSSKDGGGCLPTDAYDEPYRGAKDHRPFVGDYSSKGIPNESRDTGKYVRFEDKKKRGAVFIPYFSEDEKQNSEDSDLRLDEERMDEERMDEERMDEERMDEERMDEEQMDEGDAWMDEERMDDGDMNDMDEEQYDSDVSGPSMPKPWKKPSKTPSKTLLSQSSVKKSKKLTKKSRKKKRKSASKKPIQESAQRKPIQRKSIQRKPIQRKPIQRKPIQRKSGRIGDRELRGLGISI